MGTVCLRSAQRKRETRRRKALMLVLLPPRHLPSLELLWTWQERPVISQANQLVILIWRARLLPNRILVLLQPLTPHPWRSVLCLPWSAPLLSVLLFCKTVSKIIATLLKLPLLLKRILLCARLPRPFLKVLKRI